MIAASPVRMRGDAESFRLATDPRLVHHWAELIQTLALRVSQPWQVNPRLWAVWEQAGQNLAPLRLGKDICHARSLSTDPSRQSS